MQSLINFTLENPVLSMVLAFLMGLTASLFVWYLNHRKQQQDNRFIEQQLINAQQENKELIDNHLQLNRQQAELGERLKQMQKSVIEGEQFERQYYDLKNQMAGYKARLEEQQNKVREQAEFIKNSGQQLANQFSHIGQKILDEKGQKFTRLNQESLSNLVNPLKLQLTEFQNLINTTASRQTEQQASLKTEIKNIQKLNTLLSEQAENLTKALTAQSKVQGSWGELVLKRILETAGLVLGREFETERSFNQNGQRFRPDVLIHLPDDKQLVIDAKVSLTAYERMVNATDDTTHASELQQHVSSLKNHIKQLADKNYADIEDLNTLGFVVMFVPVEGALMTALQHDPGLLEQAYNKNVIPLSASGLLVTLRTVMRLWQFEKQNKNAQEIANRAGLLIDKFTGLLDDFKDIKDRLDQAQSAWAKADNKLSDGHGNLIRQAHQLSELGARHSKALPKLED
ncbi:DNA recombination protein RmuC [Marinicella gelatinilytica]|uniref:DNA recombination protein RmuC n=1 Tax=Marinicella gelatinilytica TaxID=2996017 RepID=UPI002260B91A|nr:DNA recombination protein RmuC [Marinicella gelatinilytica]